MVGWSLFTRITRNGKYTRASQIEESTPGTFIQPQLALFPLLPNWRMEEQSMDDDWAPGRNLFALQEEEEGRGYTTIEWRNWILCLCGCGQWIVAGNSVSHILWVTVWVGVAIETTKWRLFKKERHTHNRVYLHILFYLNWSSIEGKRRGMERDIEDLYQSKRNWGLKLSRMAFVKVLRSKR